MKPTPQILQHFFSDLAAQPQWRGQAAVDMAWRDNHQWTKAQIEHFKSIMGMPNELFVNLMASAIDAVTGHEAKHRVDWMVTAASEEQDEMAEGVNHKMNDELRLANANQACSDAYESQACVGVGWVRVGRNTDPLSSSRLLVENVHRDEMFWDMRARSADLRNDCRWIARRRFFDKDEARALAPAHKDLIDYTFSDWQTVDIGEDGLYFDWFSQLNDYSDPIELIMDNISDRPRVAIYEVHYKVIEPRSIISMADGRVSEFRPQNMYHMDMLATGQGVIHNNIPINVVRTAWFIGPHMIYDAPSQAPHREFPYVPLFGAREDATNAPTGLLRRMRGPQEQYNRAAVEIQHILRSRRVEKDNDATPGMTDPEVIHEISRTDGVINLKPGRNFKVIREWDKLAALEGILVRSRDEINAASGIYQTFQGQAEASQSGIAVENIAELGAQTLGKINANYQFARKQIGDLAFAHIIEDMGDRPETINIPQRIGQQRKQVRLNDNMGNRVQMLRAQVAIQDVHTSAGYRQHTHQRLNSIIEKVPDDIKGVLIPFWLESSELPNKEQAIKLVNKKLGYEQDEDRRTEIEEAQAQEAQEQRELEIRTAVTELEKMQAETEEKLASAEDKKAQAREHAASALKKRIETAKLIKEIKHMTRQPLLDRQQEASPETPGV